MTVLHPLQSGTVFLLLAAGCLVAFVSGCSGRSYVLTDRGPQAYYQTGYPVHDMSRELERIFRSVKRINVTGHYDTYIFSPESKITEGDIHDPALYRRAIDRISFTNSKAGTAIIVAGTPIQTALVTNNHVTDFPDTIVAYFKDHHTGPGRSPSPYIEQISIKAYQINLIYDMPEFGPFEILARDKGNDIALIGVNHRPNQIPVSPPTLRVNAGDPTKLSWGSFVYILGYPKGYKMVTRSIVSDPNRDRRASFMLDALFNEGISGGLILAVRGETGELEWIGIARGGSASTEMIITPPDVDPDDFDFLRPYEGELYITPVQRIEYGITLSVSMKVIQEFFRENERQLRSKGYSFSRFMP
jgi:hypothetical protein